MSTYAEYFKERDKLIKKIDKLNENSKGLILDYKDYENVRNHLQNLDNTLLRNMYTYVEAEYNRSRETLNNITRRMNK